MAEFTDPGFESGTGDWYAISGATRTQSSEEAHSGSNSLKVVADDGGSSQGAAYDFDDPGDWEAGEQHIFWAWVKGEVGASLRLHIQDNDGTEQRSWTADGTWQRMPVIRTISDAVTGITVSVRVNGSQTTTFYVDDVEFEVFDGSYFRAGWETGDLSEWYYVQAIEGRVTADNSDPILGTYSGRFEVQDGDEEPDTGDERAEVLSGLEYEEGDVRWFALRFRVDGWDFDNWGVIWQLHDDSAGSPPVCLMLNNVTGTLNVQHGDSSIIYWQGPAVQLGQEYTLLLRVEIGVSGSVQVWFDGEAQTMDNGEGIDTMGTPPLYDKLGIYRASAATTTAVVFFDDYRISESVPFPVLLPSGVYGGLSAEELEFLWSGQMPEVEIDYGDDRWLHAISHSHRIAVSGTLVDTLGNETDLESIVDGSVTLDANAATRGRLDLTLADDGTLDLIPDDSSDPLAPYGSEIKVSRGIEYPEGDSELQALGVYRIEDVEVEDRGGDLVLRVTGLDRSKRIIDARFEEPYEITSGTNYATAIEDTIQAAYPDVETDFTTTSRTTPHLTAEEGEDRWAFCQEMAASIGCELFFDGDGVLVLSAIVQPGSGSPDWQLSEGTDDGVLVEASRRWTREGTYNRVIATGENLGESSDPARGVATDDNPNSPTYYFGPFGKVPRFYASEFLTSDAQAADAAQAILGRELGTTQSVQFGVVVNPKIEPGATVRITRARAGVSEEDHIVDQVTIPLSVEGQMTGQTRATQVI